MTTLEAPKVNELWDRIHAETSGRAIRGKNAPTAPDGRVLFGGSVGDTAHRLESHSYHMSFEDQRHDGGYSVHYPGDARPKQSLRQFASAIDITMHDPDDMATYTNRLIRATRVAGPGALLGLREFAGTIDGRNVFAMDTHVKGKPYRTYGWDASHLWHIHLSLNRNRLDQNCILRLADIWAGDFSKTFKKYFDTGK